SSLLTRFLFLDHRYDLFVRKSCLHLSVLLLGGLYTNLEELKGRRSRAKPERVSPTSGLEPRSRMIFLYSDTVLSNCSNRTLVLCDLALEDTS
ncbi:MAG: hypothetical protein ABJ360_07255, partial [Roseobacter sp.]